MRRIKPRNSWVYVLECSDGSFYTGHTTDLEARVARHNAGWASKYTRARLPVRLVYAKEYPSKREAYAREREIKRLPRRQKVLLVLSQEGRSMNSIPN